MNPSDLPLPAALQNLIQSGFWPTTEEEARLQHSRSLISAQRVHLFAPDEKENAIFLYRPPFPLVSDCIQRGEQFWSWPMSASHEINHDLTLLIGDFGLGSDAPLALDYSRDFASPRVIRLQWGKPDPSSPRGQTPMDWKPDNHWVEVAPTFEDFARMIWE